MKPEKHPSPETQEGIDNLILKFAEKLGKIPGIMISKRLPFLVLILAVVGTLSSGIGKLRMEQSFETFFEEDDTSTADYRLFRNKFGSDESVVILYKSLNGDIFTTDSLQKIKNFEDEINSNRTNPDSALNRVKRIRSIVSADYLETRGSTMINRKFIGDNIPSDRVEIEKIKKLALAHKDYPGSYFSKDLQYGLITITTDFGTRLAPNPAGKKTEKPAGTTGGMPDEFDFESFESEKKEITGSTEKVKYEELQPKDYSPFIREIRKILNEQGWSPVFPQYGVPFKPDEKNSRKYAISGNPWVQEFVDVLTEIDMGILMTISLGITFLMLAVSFRSLSAMVWPFVIITFSELTTIGLSAWLGISASMMILIVVFLILTLGVASTVHILSGFKIFMLEGANKDDALKIAYTKSGISIILAALTTMGGLSALVLMPLVPIRNFGITATMGIFIALILTLFLLPILLSFWAPYKTGSDLKHNPVEKVFQNILRWINKVVINRPIPIMIIFLVVSVIGLSGFNRIKIDTSFSEMARDGYGISETFDIIDKFFGGASSVEFMIDSGETEGVRNVPVLNAIDRFTSRILKERPDFVPRAFSLVNAVKDSHRLLTDGNESNYKIPDTNEKLGQVLVMYDSADPESRRMMVDDDWRIARISLQVYTKSSYEYQGFMKDINTWIVEYFDPLKKEFPELKVTITGGIPLMMNVVDYISWSQVRSFALALIIVSMILFLTYGSVRFGILAIIPNLVPMTVIIGLAGWLDLELDTDTLIVMPLAIGIVVDDTIHFLTHYRAELARGATAQEAIAVSLKEVGQAMMFTSFILAGGFLVFLASVYIPFNKFGILSGGAIISALLADLFLLPSLLVVFYPETMKIKEAQSGKLKKRIEMAAVSLTFIVLALYLATPADAAPALKNPDKAKQIMSEIINRDDGSASYNETVMVSCAFKEEGGKRKCSSDPRKKVFETIGKDTGKNSKDSISLSILTEPASEKNMAFLQKDYDADEKNSEQWMYLPAMKKLKRIVSESENGPKTGTIFGSEFAYEDMERTKLSDYDYSLTGDETYEGTKVWVIESFPRQKRLPKTSYGKSKSWIDQSTLMTLKSEIYDKQNNLQKTIYFRQIEKHSGIWIARQIIMVNHRNSRMSMMKIDKLGINMNVDEDIYSTRALEETGYREKMLSPVRSKAK
jgi:hypothetical protein